MASVNHAIDVRVCGKCHICVSRCKKAARHSDSAPAALEDIDVSITGEPIC